MRALALAALLSAPASAAAAARPVPKPEALSVEELAGQLFMIAIDTTIARAREPDIRAGRLGGALLRWDKFTGDEAREFSALMQAWASSAPHPIPFWIAADHEGGANSFTQRRYGLPAFPGNMALGAADSPELARSAARAMGRELRAIGVHVTFAPVLDVNSNPANPIIGTRSFGENPHAVADLGSFALRGYAESGLLAVVKHFPGHGDTSVDSHLGLPVSTKTLAQLEAVELVPFRAARARALMPAHMVFPALGTAADQPVTLSSAALRGFLRRTLGFKGLIVSDSLDMGAIANVRGSSEAAIAALEAGADVLLLGKADFPAAHAALVQAVKDGRVPRARLEESVRRVLEEKRRQGLFAWRAPAPLPEAEREKNRWLARRAAEHAVTVVRDEGGMLPLKLSPEDTLGVVLFHSSRYNEEAAAFIAELAKLHPKLAAADIPALFPSTAAAAGALAKLAGAKAVILGSFQSGPPVSAQAQELMKRVIGGPAPVIHVSMMNPYDLVHSSGARAALCTYGMTAPALAVAAETIFGAAAPGGGLPVTVPGAAPLGQRASRGKPRVERPAR